MALVQLLHSVSGSAASVDAWERVWDQYLHFRGDPVALASRAGEDDEAFAMGPVFAAVYRVLGGSPFDAQPLVADVGRALARSCRGDSGDARRRPTIDDVVATSGHRQETDTRDCQAGDAAIAGVSRIRSRRSTDDDDGGEADHVRALERLLEGEFSEAARLWDEIAVAERDFAALRFAHDIWLHVGDNERRLAASATAIEAWDGEAGWGFVAGMHSFALEEFGRYDEAEEYGRAALAIDPDDLWARHALAHVYESTDDTPAALELLADSVARWDEQDLLATHIWWHLALRLLASGDATGALAVFDERQPHADTAFRLCDLTSLLWRLELAGHQVGDRWEALADRWDSIAERHTCGFLDVHAALAFVRRPDHPGARRWFDGLAARSSSACLPAESLAPGDAGGYQPAAGSASENDRTFCEVVSPLVDAFRGFADGDHARFVQIVDGLGASTARIGGSNAQRDLITLTRDAATRAPGPNPRGGP